MNGEERWVTVAGHDGAFEISDQGRIRSYCVHGHSRKVFRRDSPKIIPGTRHTEGYTRVSLDRGKPLYLHVLMLETFVGPRPEGHDGGHLNGDPSDNRIANLAWVTRKENVGHQIIHGTLVRGERSPHAKLTEAKVRTIRTMYDSGGWTCKKLAAEFGIAGSTAVKIVRRLTWTHVTDLERIPDGDSEAHAAA